MRISLKEGSSFSNKDFNYLIRKVKSVFGTSYYSIDEDDKKNGYFKISNTEEKCRLKVKFDNEFNLTKAILELPSNKVDMIKDEDMESDYISYIETADQIIQFIKDYNVNDLKES